MPLVTIKINNVDKEYSLPLETSLYSIKELIKKDFNINYNFNLVNNSEKIYRNFGKMFMAKGKIQQSYDNRLLSNFLNDNQSIEIGIIEFEPDEKFSQLDNIIKNINNKSNEFVYDINDFPPLS